jgi:hypothetical protein
MKAKTTRNTSPSGSIGSGSTPSGLGIMMLTCTNTSTPGSEDEFTPSLHTYLSRYVTAVIVKIHAVNMQLL